MSYQLRFLAILLAGTIGLGSLGCVNALSTLMYAVNGDEVPAEYDELTEHRVAVVAINTDNAYTNDPVAETIGRYVSEILSTELEDCTIVEEDEVQRWRDRNGWDKDDHVAMARDLNADRLILIEIGDLRLREGTTLYRGRANVLTTVHDTASGKVLFRRHIDEFIFPVTAGQYAADTTEARFKRKFLQRLADRIARYFHPYDFTQDFAADANILSQ